MELNINSPAYFNQHYGVDNEVYQFCQKAHLFFKDKEYSDTLHIIGIIPIAAPKELYNNGEWIESLTLIAKNSCATVSIRMDFEEYYKADSVEKVLLIKKAVLQAIIKISSKVKFDFDAFERDFNTVN